MIELLLRYVAGPTATAFACAVILMIALRPLANALRIVDRPGGRKMHDGDIPLTGGVAIALAVAMTVVFVPTGASQIPWFMAGVALLVAVGMLDDRYGLKPSTRLIAQICATALMIFGADVVVADLGALLSGRTVDLGILSVPFTMLIVLTAVNAFNMFDGSDGVAGGQAMIGLAFLGTASLASGAIALLPLIAAIGGAVLGFLVFNWPSRRMQRVRAFMGDAGSTTLGFALAWLSIELSQGSARVISPVVALWVFGLPIYDLFSSMLRRIVNGRSPLSGDAEHLHHLLRRGGMSSRQVAQVILVASAFLSACGLAGDVAGLSAGQLFLGWIVVGVVYHIVFGSELVVKRRRSMRPARVVAEAPSLWTDRSQVVVEAGTEASNRPLGLLDKAS